MSAGLKLHLRFNCRKGWGYEQGFCSINLSDRRRWNVVVVVGGLAGDTGRVVFSPDYRHIPCLHERFD